MSNDNLMSLVSMVEKKNVPLVLPGITIVSTTEANALKLFESEHKSRNPLVNVLFRIDLSIQCKKSTSDKWGNQQHTFDLSKIIDDDFGCQEKALMYRINANLKKYYIEKEMLRGGQKLHIFTMK
jgi:hypothetical protein